jgi:uncharacterized protein (TIGR00106 family)
VAIVAVSIAPIGTGTSVGRYVAEALRVARAQDRVRVELGAMFTTLEGELGDVLDLVRRMQDAVFAAGAERVSTVVKIDERRDRAASAAEKVQAVEALLGEPDAG